MRSVEAERRPTPHVRSLEEVADSASGSTGEGSNEDESGDRFGWYMEGSNEDEPGDRFGWYVKYIY
jgi:hypothetical protein